MAEKNYYDLIADTENTWDVEESLEELLFDCDTTLEETFPSHQAKPIRKGDILMVNNGVSDREAGMAILTPHRIYLISDAVGEPGNRVFRGYLLSSQVGKANYNHKGFPKNLYIQDYATILAKGPERHTEAFINLSDCYTIEERLMDPGHRGVWKGHAKQEFIDFIDRAVADIEAGKSTATTFWLDT